MSDKTNLRDLERAVANLERFKGMTYSSADLFISGYKPMHQTFRRRIGNQEICFSQIPGESDFRYAAVINHSSNYKGKVKGGNTK